MCGEKHVCFILMNLKHLSKASLCITGIPISPVCFHVCMNALGTCFRLKSYNCLCFALNYTATWNQSAPATNVSVTTNITFKKIIFYCAGWGYIVAFTKILTMCKYFILELPPSTAHFIPPPRDSWKFQQVTCLYLHTCVYIICTVFILLSFSPTTSPHPPSHFVEEKT
jgi:hypothetical protein